MRLALAGITKAYGAQLVLDNVSISVGPRSRIGLVGPNGVGKTTLLRLLAGLDEPDGGAVTRAPETLVVGYVEQERNIRPGETLLEYLARRTGVAAAERELERLTEALETDSDAADAYSAALERFLALGGADLPARAAAVCADLGLGVELRRALDGVSGGEMGRAALAAVLLSRFDVYLLDEPTNDLDLDGLDRLERFLSGLRGGLVVISHDRAFLDATVTTVAEIEPGPKKLREWPGGWSEYAEARDLDRRRAYQEFERAQGRRLEIEQLVRRRQGEARGGARMSYRRGTHALMTKVRQAQRALDRVETRAKPFEPWELRLELVAGPRPAKVLVALEGAVVERGDFRLGPIDLAVGRGERISITGRNGSGKSTLMETLAGTLPLTAGRRIAAARTEIGVIGQGRSAYHGNESVLERFAARTGASAEDARTLLAKFGLGADQLRRSAASLSPGERTRAHLAELQRRRVNLLLLDEPTNHLDLEAVEELEHALVGWTGSLVVVSHDRRLLDALGPARTVGL